MIWSKSLQKSEEASLQKQLEITSASEGFLNHQSAPRKSTGGWDQMLCETFHFLKKNK